jgi:hypothetical protein
LPIGYGSGRLGGGKHLDEIVTSIAEKKHWLWRAIGLGSFVPYDLAQSRRAKHLFRKQGWCSSPTAEELRRRCQIMKPVEIAATGPNASFPPTTKVVNVFPHRRDHGTAATLPFRPHPGDHDLGRGHRYRHGYNPPAAGHAATHHVFFNLQRQVDGAIGCLVIASLAAFVRPEISFYAKELAVVTASKSTASDVSLIFIVTRGDGKGA